MSTELEPIERDGDRDEISVTRFKGQNAMCLQFTQGVSFNQHDPGFIQVTNAQAADMIKTLSEFVSD